MLVAVRIIAVDDVVVVVFLLLLWLNSVLLTIARFSANAAIFNVVLDLVRSFGMLRTSCTRQLQRQL